MRSIKFNCTVICPETPKALARHQLLVASDQFSYVEWLRDFPDEGAVLRMLRLNTMDVLILDASNLQPALRIIELLRRHSTGIELLVYCHEDVATLSALMRLGVTQYLSVDSSEQAFGDALQNILGKLRERPSRPYTGGSIVSFLSAKAGSGASTVAANTADAASRRNKGRVLLADFDRYSGIQSFLFKIPVENSLQEAMGLAQKMDEEMWTRIRRQRNELDIVPSDLQSTSEHLLDSTRSLLNFWRRTYDLVCVDLPSVVDPHAIEVMLESKTVYVVCTQDLTSLHLALNRVSRLQRLGLTKVIKLLVNRYSSTNVMTLERIANIVGAPVEMTIPNNYALATTATEHGSLVDPSTALGKSYRQLALSILEEKVETPAAKKSFLSYLYQPFLKDKIAAEA